DGSFFTTGQPTSVACGALSTGGVTVLFPSGRLAFCNAVGSFDTGRDVAVAPDGSQVYSVPAANGVLAWGRLSSGPEPAPAGAGPAPGRPGRRPPGAPGRRPARPPTAPRPPPPDRGRTRPGPRPLHGGRPRRPPRHGHRDPRAIDPPPRRKVRRH